MRDIDPLVWFGTRDVSPAPKHFIKTPTPTTSESLIWVITKLKGRYSLSTIVEDGTSVLILGNDIYQTIYFEEPADAMMYELRWAGGK